MFNDRSNVGKHFLDQYYVTSTFNWKTHILLVFQRICKFSSDQNTFHYYFQSLETSNNPNKSKL